MHLCPWPHCNRCTINAMMMMMKMMRTKRRYVDDVLTDEGNAFQARAAATGKAGSPRVACCIVKQWCFAGGEWCDIQHTLLCISHCR